MSSAVPKRPNGFLAAILAAPCSLPTNALVILLGKGPGAKALKVMFRLACSRAKIRVI